MINDYNLHIRTFPNNIFNENGFLGAKARVIISILNMKHQRRLEIISTINTESNRLTNI